MAGVSGKVCIVTGAASGLGAADAAELARHGARVMLTDVTTEAGERLAASLPECAFLSHDVRDEDAWGHVVHETVRRFGRLDVLVNNAGIARFDDIETCTLAEFRLVNAIMLEGTFLGCKHAIPALAASGGGSIINMASTAAVVGFGALPAYTAAKGGIVALTRSVAVHCQDKGYGIRCNVVLPGSHDTPMVAAATRIQGAESEAVERASGQGIGDAQDVANLVLFLASDESRTMTGASFVIDNGVTIR